jgi:hypothetical protein
MAQGEFCSRSCLISGPGEFVGPGLDVLLAADFLDQLLPGGLDRDKQISGIVQSIHIGQNIAIHVYRHNISTPLFFAYFLTVS